MRIKYLLTKEAIEASCKFQSPNSGDVGYDIHSSETHVIPGHSQRLIKTGLYLAMPKGVFGMIKDRSSVASSWVRVGAGIIDPAYRGEISVVLYNHNPAPYKIDPGKAIAQILFLPLLAPTLLRVSNSKALGATKRGELGFGKGTNK